MNPTRPPDHSTEPEPVDDSATKVAGDPNGTPGRSVTVVVVDDNPSYLSVAGAVVEATSGFELVGTATTVEDAIATIVGLAAAPDLVLLDINLGEGSGLDVARAVAGDRPAMRIVLISTLGAEDLPADIRRCGAAGYLPKVALGPASLRAAAAGAYDWAP